MPPRHQIVKIIIIIIIIIIRLLRAKIVKEPNLDIRDPWWWQFNGTCETQLLWRLSTPWFNDFLSPWNWGWRPCLRNTCPVQPSIVCSHAQNCHSWLFSLAFPALSNIIKFFSDNFPRKTKTYFHLVFKGTITGWVSVVIKKSLQFLTPFFWHQTNEIKII